MAKYCSLRTAAELLSGPEGDALLQPMQAQEALRSRHVVTCRCFALLDAGDGEAERIRLCLLPLEWQLVALKELGA